MDNSIKDDTFKFLYDCEHGGDVLSRQIPPSIYMVPGVFRDLSPSSFNPRVVSIGPLHRHDKNLQGFEVQKTTYLHNLVHRLHFSPKQKLEECAEKVSFLIDKIKACYVGSTTYNDAELASMMVIDGFFILEFIYGLSDLSSGSNMLITQSIIYDLLLIENQIPFFVLEKIFECTILKSVPTASLTAHMEVLVGYYKVIQGNSIVPNASLATTHDHILGFVHKFYQPADVMPSTITLLSLNPMASTPISVPLLPMTSKLISNPKGHSAVELDRAGMDFKPHEDKNWAMAMKLELPRFSWFPWFWCKPTLRMPILSINDFTERVLRNIIIYEQSSNVKKYVTAYASAMDMLIDTPQDVAILIKSKVLNNDLGSNENAANMINNICKEVPVVEFFYHREWEEMDAYYNGYWPNTAAGLKRTYFNSPWNIIALFAAFVLFSLTVAQTIFTIKAANLSNVTN